MVSNDWQNIEWYPKSGTDDLHFVNKKAILGS